MIVCLHLVVYTTTPHCRLLPTRLASAPRAGAEGVERVQGAGPMAVPHPLSAWAARGAAEAARARRKIYVTSFPYVVVLQSTHQVVILSLIAALILVA